MKEQSGCQQNKTENSHLHISWYIHILHVTKIHAGPQPSSIFSEMILNTFSDGLSKPELLERRMVAAVCCGARWGAHVLPELPPVTSNCPRFQQKWQMAGAGIRNICAARLLVERPQRPACLHQPLLNCRSKYTALIGMACSCYSEGGSSATTLWCPPVCPKQPRPFSALSVSHLDRDFSILQSDFWSEADKRQIYMVWTAMPCPE